MSVMKRLTLIFRAKANKALDRPRTRARPSTTPTSASSSCCRRYAAASPTWPPAASGSSCRSTSSQQQSDKLEAQARQALAQGREDLAREALTRRSGAPAADQPTCTSQHAQLQAEEEKLTLASQRLQAKVDAFRTRKETIKATYTAAEAQTKIGEAFSGISEEMGDVGLAIQRAEDKTAADAGPRRRDRRAARLAARSTTRAAPPRTTSPSSSSGCPARPTSSSSWPGSRARSARRRPRGHRGSAHAGDRAADRGRPPSRRRRGDTAEGERP